MLFKLTLRGCRRACRARAARRRANQLTLLTLCGCRALAARVLPVLEGACVPLFERPSLPYYRSTADEKAPLMKKVMVSKPHLNSVLTFNHVPPQKRSRNDQRCRVCESFASIYQLPTLPVLYLLESVVANRWPSATPSTDHQPYRRTTCICCETQKHSAG